MFPNFKILGKQTMDGHGCFSRTCPMKSSVNVLKMRSLPPLVCHGHYFIIKRYIPATADHKRKKSAFIYGMKGVFPISN